MARIQGDRIVLREFWQEDLEDIHSWACDPRTAAMLGEVFIRPRTREQTQEYLDNLLEGGLRGQFRHRGRGQPELSGPVQFDDGGRHRPEGGTGHGAPGGMRGAGLWL